MLALTGSVAIKNAPSMVAPESRWIMGDAVVPGAKSCASNAVKTKPASIAIGMCQRIIRSFSRIRPPSR
ncbi:Uncharacterised protein [Vibrio cholerae]|nr:Uncharacterised protein [Vibrio cholerae]